MSFNGSLLTEIAEIVDDESIPRSAVWLRITDALRGQTVYFPNNRRAWLGVAVRRMARDKSVSIRGIARRLGAPKTTVARILSHSCL